MSYLTNITLNGTPFTVQIDAFSTGGFWIPTPLNGAIDTGRTDEYSFDVSKFGLSSATGPLKTADMAFAGYTVQDQVFMTPSSFLTNPNFTFGVLGLAANLGPDGVLEQDAPLTRITQAANMSEVYATFTVGRTVDDPSQTSQGQLTVGEVLPGYEAVLQQPKLSISTSVLSSELTNRWMTPLDADGLTVNGQHIKLPGSSVGTVVNGTRIMASFRHTISGTFLPQAMVDAIYANIKGAKFNASSATYSVPCSAEVNVTFMFQGVPYPIHPLDTVTRASSDPQAGCVGGFQVLSVSSTDMLLGPSFLRNVYMLNSYGELNTSALPYMQLLSMSNDSAALHSEFVKLRSGSAGVSRPGAVAVLAIAAATLAVLLLG